MKHHDCISSTVKPSAMTSLNNFSKRRLSGRSIDVVLFMFSVVCDGLCLATDKNAESTLSFIQWMIYCQEQLFSVYFKLLI